MRNIWKNIKKEDLLFLLIYLFCSGWKKILRRNTTNCHKPFGNHLIQAMGESVHPEHGFVNVYDWYLMHISSMWLRIYLSIYPSLNNTRYKSSFLDVGSGPKTGQFELVKKNIARNTLDAVCDFNGSCLCSGNFTACSALIEVSLYGEN